MTQVGTERRQYNLRKAILDLGMKEWSVRRIGVKSKEAYVFINRKRREFRNSVS